jgi:hypothetical protein
MMSFLTNITVIFYELWTFAYFDRLCKWHIFGREPSNDYFINILFLLSKWFQTRRFLWEFPIGSYVKLSSAVAAILVWTALFLARKCPHLNCISIMMSFLTYITVIFYELWTFAYFDWLCKLEKRGMKLKSGHLGYRTALTDTILKGDHTKIISAKFGWDWLSSFREDFF